MSVLKSKRNESKVEFIKVAGEIFTRTVAFVSRMSARYGRLIASDTVHLASEVLAHAEKANAIYPSDDERRRLRTEHLLEARASLMALDVHLSQVYAVLVMNPEGAFERASKKPVEKYDAERRLQNMAQTLGELIDQEDKLLTGVLKNSKKRE